MKTLNAKSAIPAGHTPTTAGEALATAVLKSSKPELPALIDVSTLESEDLVSSFVNAFLHGLEHAGIDITGAGDVKWKTKHADDATYLAEVVKYYLEDFDARHSATGTEPKSTKSKRSPAGM